MTTITVAERAAAPTSASPPRAANQIARHITGRDYVSYSQLSLMRSCPQKFSFQYVEQAPKDFIPLSLLYGGSIHGALETYYRGQLEGRTLSSDEMMLAYHAAWRENRQKSEEFIPIKYGVKDDESAVTALAERTIAAFLSSPLATPKGTVVGIEEELKIVLHPELPDVLAKVDLVTSTDTALYVTDFKTSRSKWTLEKAQESSDQLVLYASVAAEMAQQLTLPIKLAFAILTKAKAPQIQILPVPTDTLRIAVMTEAAVQTWSAITEGHFYPNPSPMNCSTCPYRSLCPVFKR